ncbi:MAG TPA: hypothetical protein VKS82_00890 [Streptosporangiaceae bacterium]|nr:hypothetical protein [Streptosporangiaceae bacterium]
MNATGAMLVGPRTAEQAGYHGGDHHGVPVFVPATARPALRRELSSWGRAAALAG